MNFCIDNLHKHPCLCNLLCKIGRHDYEAKQALSTGYILLYCFYCENSRLSKALLPAQKEKEEQ